MHTDEIDDEEFLNFAVENISELFGYLATGRVNIRICRDITGEIWARMYPKKLQASTQGNRHEDFIRMLQEQAERKLEDKDQPFKMIECSAD